MVATQSFKVLFVCTGNIARSPLAEAFAGAFVSRNGSPVRWEVSSAGTHAVPGDPVRPEVLRVAEGFGFNLSSLRARPLTPELCLGQDLILAMGWDQVAHIWSLVPQAWDRAFTLKEWIHYAKQAPTTPKIMFPDQSAAMRDKISRAHALRKRARSDLGFWGGLRPQDLNVVEPDSRHEPAWTNLAQGIRALVTDSIRLLGGP